jgi:protease-4
MGDVAASGGYWVAMNADRIVAEPGTLTGSIGVFAGKFVLGGLMKKLGVNFDALRTTDSAGLWSMTDTFSPAQRERVSALLDETYQAFLKNVSSARKIPMEKMPDIAKGRVWTGEQAAKIGLVDALGGYDVALKELRDKLKMKETDMLTLEPFPAPETPFDRMLKVMKNFGIESAIMVPAVREWQRFQAILGPVWHELAAPRPVEARVPDAVLELVR